MLRGGQKLAQREWAGSPIHLWQLARPRPDGLADGPRSRRPADPEIGRQILAGRLVLAGATDEFGAGGDPWDRPSPTRRFAQALHRFEWLGDLLALGEAGQAEAMRLVAGWDRVFGRWNGFSWDASVLERRTASLACAAFDIAPFASEGERDRLALNLARQGRHLLALALGPARASERAVAAALAGTALAGEAGEILIDQGLLALERHLPVTVQSDGGHASRSPRAALELLLDLQALDGGLERRGIATPDTVMRAIDRLVGVVRFFCLPDGQLPEFQGGDAASVALVQAALPALEVQPPPPASRNGYHRLIGRQLQVIADAAPPASGAWSEAACAQPLAMEVMAGPRRLIVSCGWTPDAAGPQAMRLADAASTVCLGDQTCGAPMRGFLASGLGARLIGAYGEVEARRHAAEGGLWLELSHDGWAPRFGLRHERRLYLDLATDELRGEERLVNLQEVAPEAGRFVPFVVRFHIHPDVRASLARDAKSVLLRADGEETGWWLRNDAQEVSVETSVYFRAGQPRRAQQVVLRGHARPDVGARVRWKLAAAEAWPPPH